MATNGIVLLTPSSVDVTGSGSETATINTNGSVTFSACATLSLNDVFSSTYDNYVIDMRSTNTIDGRGVSFRIRGSGTDESSGSNYYTRQFLLANGSSVSGARSSQSLATVMGTDSRLGGGVVYIYGPALAQPTAFRSVNAESQSSAMIFDNAGTHSLSTAYDGFTLYPTSGEFSGLIKVYGLVQ